MSVSLHETHGGAAAYAAGLRRIYGMDPGAEAGTTEGLAVVVLVEGATVASAVGPSGTGARVEAGRALASAR